MRLATEETVVSLAGHPVTLRPSLRAATRLVRKHKAIDKLALGVLRANTEIMADLIREGSGSRSAADDFYSDLELQGAKKTLAGVQMPLAQFVADLAGYDPDAKPAPVTTEPMPLLDFLERLFVIATGWLGWTPAQAWDATPAEIIAAKNGRTEMITDILTAVFGASDGNETIDPEQRAANEAEGLDPEFDRAGLAALKAKLL